MLYLPTYIFGEMFKKQYWTPVEFMDVILTAQEEYDMQIESDMWVTVKQWCIAAMQLATPTENSSHVAITVEAITQADDIFLDWCKFRINTTLGGQEITTLRSATPPPKQAQTVPPAHRSPGMPYRAVLPTTSTNSATQATGTRPWATNGLRTNPGPL
jgi:hypothetical protein